jgi:hypothetical protein
LNVANDYADRQLILLAASETTPIRRFMKSTPELPELAADYSFCTRLISCGAGLGVGYAETRT